MLLVAGVIVIATRQEGMSAQAVELGTGSVWVTSNGPGQMALLDGASAQVAVRLRVAQDGDDVLAVQGRNAGYAVNRTNGTVRRVDTATWHTGPPTVLIDGSSAELTAVTGDQKMFATDVSRGLIVRADPATLQPDSPPQPLAATADASSLVVDRRDAVWLLDTAHGDLVRMTNAPETMQTGIAHSAHSRMVLANDHPVLVDLTAGTATPIDPETGQVDDPACVNTNPTDPTVRVLGSHSNDEIYTISGATGDLRITDLTTGSCDDTIDDLAAPGSDLAQPIETTHRVFIPNYSTGRVVVVDLDTRTIHTTEPVVDPGATFELIAQDGFVFYNDRVSNKAGVINTNGTIRAIVKYDATAPDKGVYQPEPEPTTQTHPNDPRTLLAAAEPPQPQETDSDTTQTHPNEPNTPLTTPTAAEPHQPQETQAPPAATSAPLTPSTPSTTSNPAPSTSPDPRSLNPAPPPTTELPAAPPPDLTHAVTITIVGNGAINDLADGITCSGPGTCAPTTVRDGTTITLTAAPGAVTWSGACTGTGNQCQLTVHKATTIGADFTPLTTDLTITINGEGSVTDQKAITCATAAPPCGTVTVASGTPITLHAVPAAGWTFTGWTGDCIGTDPCTLTMTTPHHIGATFTALYTLTVSTLAISDHLPVLGEPLGGPGGEPGGVHVTGGGIDCPGSTCTIAYRQPTTVTLIASPDETHYLLKWSDSVHCAALSSTCTVMVDRPRTVDLYTKYEPVKQFAGTWVRTDGLGADTFVIPEGGFFNTTVHFLADCSWAAPVAPEVCDWGTIGQFDSYSDVGPSPGDATAVFHTPQFANPGNGVTLTRTITLTRVGEKMRAEIVNYYEDNSPTPLILMFRRQ
jgi:uncharacterized repeat protein (TIGR02543 family)